MSDTNRGRKRQAPTESSNHSETNENLSADDVLSLPGTATYDETFSQISNGKRRRKRFTSERRQEVANVRKVGACQECRARKVACKHALQGTEAHPDPAPTSKPSPQTYPSDFEAVYPQTIYPTRICDDDAGQWPQSDEAQPQDLPFNDGSRLIARVPANPGRQERMDLYLDDFDNIIGDYSGGSEVRTVSNGSEWGQTPQWMANATTLTNNQQYSQPSSAYSYSNQDISVDVGPSPSTPASSTADVLSRNTQNMGHYRCNVQGCNHTRIFTKETALMRHQEIKHADLFPPQITYACQAAECAANRYGTLERLHIHIRCNHPEALESPAQLPTLNVSDRCTQPDRRAQVNEFLAGEYIPGMEDNPIAIPDQRTLGEIYPLTVGNLRLGKSSGGAHHQRVYGEPCMRRSTSPMQNQLSARTADEPAHNLQGQFSITSSKHGMGFTTTTSNAPFRRPQHTREELSNFNGQLQNHPHHTNSPTSSLPGHFANSMQISNQSHPFQTCSDIEKEVQAPAIQPDHLGIFTTTNTAPLDASATLVEDWRLEDHSTMAFNTHTLNPYGNLGDTQPEVSFQPGYICSDMGVRAWSGHGRLGHGRSTSIARTSGFGNDYAPPDFQSGTQDVHCLTNNATSPSFLVLPGDATRPMITLSGADFAFTPNTFSSDQILSQPNSLPNLVHGNFSSSGASESVVSPVEAPNTFNDNFREDWDACSNFFNDFSNIEINTSDEAS